MPQSKDLPGVSEFLPLTVAISNDLVSQCTTEVRIEMMDQKSR